MTAIAKLNFTRAHVEDVAIASAPKGTDVISYTDRDRWLNLRKQDVTASSAAALFNEHPYQTPYSLWAEKTGRAPPIEGADPVITGSGIEFPPMARGHLFEAPAVEALRQYRPDWQIAYPLSLYWRSVADRVGATPDVLVIDPARKGFGVVQIKTVNPRSFRETWVDPDTNDVIPPLWIALQAMVEAKVTGASWAAVVALVVDYDCKMKLVPAPISDKAYTAFCERARAFWRMVADGHEPAPDYPRDGDLLRHLYADSNGSTIDLSSDSRMAEIVTARAKLKALEADGAAAERSRKTLDAEIIHKLGNAEAARLPGGGIVSAKTIKRGGYSVEPTSYRTVTVRGWTPETQQTGAPQ